MYSKTVALVIGDPHFKVKNIPEVELFIDKIVEVAERVKPDFIVNLGDLLDTHERLHTIPMNKALEFIDKLRKISHVYSIIGNHDMTHQNNFLSVNHWQNSLKKWENVTVVDKVISDTINDEQFVFVPYVYPGRFEEALDTLDVTWKSAKCIFAHQEFYGCKMGAIISEIGDKWSLDHPNVISGHIHSKQKIQDNIYYTGSAMQNAFGESSKNIIGLVEFTEKSDYNLEEIDLELPRKRIIYKDFTNIKEFKIPKTKDKIKISISGTYEEFKTFKKTSKYKTLLKRGIKVVYNNKNEEIIDEYSSIKTLSFSDALFELLKDEEYNKELKEIYNNIS